MGCYFPSPAEGQDGGPPPNHLSAKGSQRHLLCEPRGWCLAHAAEGLPPYQTVYRYFRAWSKDGTWEKVHDALRDRVRQKAGREASPSAAAIDSQSVKTTEKGDPEGTMRGRKSKDASGIWSSTR